jgi:2,3-bisphosphoglycerate-dependent phosphoglycerate mutase
MFTKIYFIRHSEADFSIKDDFSRPLSSKGANDSKKLVNFFKNKNIDLMFSSPYKRATDTIKPISEKLNISIETINNFRERKISNGWIKDFSSYAKQQWQDFTFKLPEGECLNEVQERNVTSLFKLLEAHQGKNIIIGTHGTALSTIINYFDSNFGYDNFMKIKDVVPLIVTMSFKNNEIKSLIIGT